MARDADDSPPTHRPFAFRAWTTVTAVYALALLAATHYPRPQDLLGPNPPSDKLMHVVAYAILGLLVAITLAAAGHGRLRTLLAAALCLACFAALDEITQPLPWFRRAADPADWAWDMAGVAAGLTVGTAVGWLARRQKFGVGAR